MRHRPLERSPSTCPVSSIFSTCIRSQDRQRLRIERESTQAYGIGTPVSENLCHGIPPISELSTAKAPPHRFPKRGCKNSRTPHDSQHISHFEIGKERW